MKKIKIGNVEIEGGVFLAPMAGVSDFSFRLICQNLGANLTYTEMISAKALYFNDKNTKEISYIDEEEKNVALQIFGNDEYIIRDVIQNYLNYRDDVKIIDLNFGCPAPKIVKNEDGSFLLKNPQKIYDIIYEAKKVSQKPITAKFRMGFDENLINYKEVGSICQNAGADMVTLHGRTRDAFYSGKANWDCIRILKERLNIPVVANGDVDCLEKYEQIKKITLADAVMIGRGALGNPFIFRDIKNSKFTKRSYDEIFDTIKLQYTIAQRRFSKEQVVRRMRKHVSWYIKGFRESSTIRNEIVRKKEMEDVFKILDEYKEFLKRL